MGIIIPKCSIIVDTESYSGNFERELTAYCTGAVGDCGVGSDMSDEFFESGGVASDLIVYMPGVSIVNRPSGVASTPGWFNNGLGGMFRHGCEDAALAHHNAYLDGEVEHVDSDVEIKRINDRRVEQVRKWPAYMSVEVYLSGEPDDYFVADFCSRARRYCELNDIVLTGFRLLKYSVSVSEEFVVLTD